MWYIYQIINKETNELIQQSFEEFESHEIAEKIAETVLSFYRSPKRIGCMDDEYIYKIMPVKESFIARLKIAVLKFDIYEAECIINAVGEYISEGGELTREESKLFTTLTMKLGDADQALYELCTL